MEQPASPADAFGRLLDVAVTFARTSEKLIAAGATLLPVSQSLADVRDLDPALEPEINVAFGHVQEALAAIRRAGEFATARFDVSVDDGLRDALDGPSTEGDTQ